MPLSHEFDDCASISDADFQSVLDSCDFSDEGQVKDLIAKTYTPHKFNEKVAEVHFNKPDSAYNYFSDFYPTAVWEDGMGQSEDREIYYAPQIGYDFSRFIRTMQICDPNAADECNTCYEVLPDGARGSLPPLEMYKWAFKTQPQCIANMRHIRDFRAWGQRLVRGWYALDEQVMNMFYMFATIRLTGHKLVTQGTLNADGSVSAVTSNDPKNPFLHFLYNYQEPLFPQVQDADLIMPLEYDYLEQAARYWAHWNSGNAMTTGSRGQKVYQMWYPEDWYRDNVLKNPEYFKALLEYKPASTMAGYSLTASEEQVEILGNWAVRQMPALPRFVESQEGGLIPVDNFVTEEVEIGDRPVPAGRDWLNAPFLMMIMPSPKAGKILYRPDLTTSVEGWPINPIMGRGGWQIRNDYDKDCNEDLNMPHARRRYETGFQLENPDAAMSVIFRNKVFSITASNRCDWAEVVTKAEPSHTCASDLTCNDNQRHAPAVVTTTDTSAYVECSCESCGDDTMYRLKLTHKAYKKDYIPFDATCGDTLKALVSDGSAPVTKEVDVTLVEYMAFPYNLYWVQAASADDIADDECIVGLMAYDATPTVADILDCWDDTMPGFGDGDPDDLNGNLRLLLSDPLNCGSGDSATIESFDADGVSLGTTAVTIASVNQGNDVYEVSGAGDLTCELQTGEASKKITCA